MNSTKVKTKTISDKVLFFAMFMFPMPVFRVRSITMAAMLMTLYVLMMLESKRKITLDRIGTAALLVSVVTLFVTFAGNMENSWKMHAFSQFGQFVLLILFYFIARKYFNKHEISIALSGLKISCNVNLILCFLQAISWYIFSLDLNDIIFNQILHIQEDASKMRFGHVSVSGFGWHPAQLVPILLFLYFETESYPKKIAVIIIGLLTSNFTCTLTVVLCVGFSVLDRVFTTRKKNKYKRIGKRNLLISIILLSGLTLIVFLNADIINGAIDNAFLNFQRINYAVSGNYDSGSTMKHTRYYLGYPQVVSSSNFLQNMFGYGIDCSGLPYSQLFAQNSEKLSWHVESDIINILVGRGWIWFIMLYTFLINIALKGYKISYKYRIAIFILIIDGIFYDCQGRWTMYWEVLMYIAIRKGIDIWDPQMSTLRERKQIESVDNKLSELQTF